MQRECDAVNTNAWQLIEVNTNNESYLSEINIISIILNGINLLHII